MAICFLSTPTIFKRSREDFRSSLTTRRTWKSESRNKVGILYSVHLRPQRREYFSGLRNLKIFLRQSTNMTRTSPNIIVTGTPGVGKTSHAEMLAEKTGLKHLAINKFAEENDCYDGRDEERQSWIVDEDKVVLAQKLEPISDSWLILRSY